MDKHNHQTWITGIGIVSPQGNDWNTVFSNMLDPGEASGLSAWGDELLPPAQGCHLGIVKQYPVDRYFTPKQVRLIDKAMGMAAVASGSALEDAGFGNVADGISGGEDVATIFGTTRGEMSSLFRFGLNVLTESGGSVNPALFPMVARNVACGQTAIRFGLSGWSSMMSSGSLAGLHAVARGRQLIEAGRADIVLVGAFESLSKLTLQIFKSVYADVRWHAEPDFFGDSGGRLWPAEGAAVLVLESRRHAERRGVTPYATLQSAYFGGGTNGNLPAFSRALIKAGSADAGIFVTSQSGAATESDRIEHRAIHDALPQDGRRSFTTAPKSFFGEMESVSGVLGVAIAATALRHRALPQTRHCGYRVLAGRQVTTGGPIDTRRALVTGVDSKSRFSVVSLEPI